MSKSLIITEKPSVAREFARALGVNGAQDGYIENDKWVITWCVGHLITLSMPEVYDEDLKRWKLSTLPFLPDSYKYEVIRQTADQFKTVKKLLNRSDIGVIYNAGDSGREGEYIQRLVYMMAGIQGKKTIKRIWIDSQTDAELLRGIREAKPASDYDNLSAAAYERAIADYAVGINLSRALSCKFGPAFNARSNTGKYIPMAVGRVMTCVLGMVVDREREIREFKPTDYYKIDADHGGWTSHWKAVKGSPIWGNDADKLYNDSGLKNKADAEALVADLQKDPRLKVLKVERKTEKQQSPTLFSLSELQAECTKRYHISPDRTLSIAQALYEAKLTTYPRTDARVLSTAVAVEVDRNIKGVGNILGWKTEVEPILKNGWFKGIEKNKRYVDDSKITDHYAIIPTGEGDLSNIGDLERKVYELICRRFLAAFYPPAEYAKTNVELCHISNGEHFFASEKVLMKPGYRDVYIVGKSDSDDDEEEDEKSGLAQIKDGQIVAGKFSVITSTTQPPKRYTSGSMILAMEAAGKLIDDPELRAQIKTNGIGTSATRADTISKLEHNCYIDIDGKTQVITPTSLGEILYDIVKDTIPQLLSPRMTASWEKGLSQVESGKTSAQEYRTAIEQFVRTSVDTVKSKEAQELPKMEPIKVGQCPRCGRDVVEGRKGFGCVGYKDETNKCSFVLWKSNGLLATGKKTVPSDMAKKLLAGESVVVSGLKSKAGKSYSGRFTMKDDGENVNLEMSFDDLPPKRKSGYGRKKKA